MNQKEDLFGGSWNSLAQKKTYLIVAGIRLVRNYREKAHSHSRN